MGGKKTKKKMLKLKAKGKKMKGKKAKGKKTKAKAKAKMKKSKKKAKRKKKKVIRQMKSLQRKMKAKSTSMTSQLIAAQMKIAAQLQPRLKYVQLSLKDLARRTNSELFASKPVAHKLRSRIEHIFKRASKRIRDSDVRDSAYKGKVKETIKEALKKMKRIGARLVKTHKRNKAGIKKLTVQKNKEAAKNAAAQLGIEWLQREQAKETPKTQKQMAPWLKKQAEQVTKLAKFRKGVARVDPAQMTVINQKVKLQRASIKSASGKSTVTTSVKTQVTKAEDKLKKIEAKNEKNDQELSKVLQKTKQGKEKATAAEAKLAKAKASLALEKSKVKKLKKDVKTPVVKKIV